MRLFTEESYRILNPARAGRKNYRIRSESEVLLRNYIIKNKQEWEVELTLMQPLNDGAIYNVRILNFKQEKEDGLNSWQADLTNTLKKELTIQTDESGRIKHVLQKKELLDYWHGNKNGLRRKHRKDPATADILKGIEAVLEKENGLEETLANSGIYGILFPGLYGTYSLDTPLVQQKSVPHQFGRTPLPLNTLVTMTEHEILFGKVSMNVKGETDEENMNKEEIAGTMRLLTDTYNAKINIDVKHTETYELSPKGWIEYAGQFLQAHIEGIYGIRTMYQLEPLKPS